MLCRAMWCFIVIYMVAHISVALIFYLYYTTHARKSKDIFGDLTVKP